MTYYPSDPVFLTQGEPISLQNSLYHERVARILSDAANQAAEVSQRQRLAVVTSIEQRVIDNYAAAYNLTAAQVSILVRLRLAYTNAVEMGYLTTILAALTPAPINPEVYIQQVIAISPSTLRQYLPMLEVSGTNADDRSGNNRDGTFVGVTLDAVDAPAGGRAGLWTPNTSYVHNYNAALSVAIEAQEFTYGGWLRVATNEWASTTQRIAGFWRSNASNFTFIHKAAAANRLVFDYRAGGVDDPTTLNNITKASWCHVALVVSKAGDYARAYVDFVLRGTQTGLGTWASALTSADTVIGARNTTPLLVWNGSLAHWFLSAAPFNQTQIDALRPAATSGNPLMVFDGDSLTEGAGSTGGQTYPVQTMALVGGTWDVSNFADGGYGTANVLAHQYTLVDPPFAVLRPRNIVVIWIGSNDLKNAVAEASVYADIVTFCTNRRLNGYQVVVLTILPRSGDTPPGFEAERQALNTDIRTNWATFADALADVGNSPIIGDAGDELNLTYYDADAVHMTNTGYGVVAGIVKAAIDTL